MIHSRGNKSLMPKSKLCTGTSKLRQLVSVHLDPPLFWKSHSATCVPACVILYQNVTRSCRGPISNTIWWISFSFVVLLFLFIFYRHWTRKLKTIVTHSGHFTRAARGANALLCRHLKPSATVQQYKPPKGHPHLRLPRGHLGPLTVYLPHGNLIIQLERGSLLLCYNMQLFQWWEAITIVPDWKGEIPKTVEGPVVAFIANSLGLRFGPAEMYHCLVEIAVKEFRVRYNSAVADERK